MAWEGRSSHWAQPGDCGFVLQPQRRALRRGRTLRATQAAYTGQTHATLHWECDAPFLFALMGTQGFLPRHWVKTTPRDTHKGSSSQFSLWSQRRLLCRISGRCVWHQTVQLYFLGQGDSHDLHFRQAGTTGRQHLSRSISRCRHHSRPGRCSLPGPPHPVAIGTYTQVMLRDVSLLLPEAQVPGQNANASSKTNHQIICLLNNVSMGRGTGSHPFAMHKHSALLVLLSVQFNKETKNFGVEVAYVLHLIF